MEDIMKALIEAQAGRCPYMCTIDLRHFVETGENVTLETFQAYVTKALEFHAADVEDKEFDCTIPGTPVDLEELKLWRTRAENCMLREFNQFLARCTVMDIEHLDAETIGALDVEGLFTLGRFCCYQALFQACKVTKN